MAKWFRSEEMEYVSLIVNEDAAHAAVNDLGMLGVIQFTDLNHEQVAFQRRYVSYIKRCDELERKLRYIRGEIAKFGLDTEVPGGFQQFLAQSQGDAKEQRSGAYVLEQLETKLEDHEQQLLELSSFGEKITREYNEKVEFQEVLQKVQRLFATDSATILKEEQQQAQQAAHRRERSGDSLGTHQDNARPLLNAEAGAGGASGGAAQALDKDMRFSFLAGVVNEEDRGRFERMLFRATKGNVYTRFAEIELPIVDPVTQELRKKAVFVVFYKSATIEKKIIRICDAFAARRYPVPDLDDAARVREVLADTSAELLDARVVLQKNKDAQFKLCKSLAGQWEEWMWTVVREKSVYHTLNNFKSDVSGMLRGEGWVVASAIKEARAAIANAHNRYESSMPSLLEKVPKPWPTPPTYFETNAFTWAFQEFVDTYGVPRYREANPALFTAATFPFLFAVMYGDMGHGFCLFLLGVYLVLTEKRAESRNPGALGALYPARYMLLLMGVFAVYTGLIYNDYFALPLNLFGSRYSFDDVKPAANAKLLYKYGDYQGVYPFGVDPAWHLSENSLLFLNSLKMKLSVVLGIIHMTWGILLRGANALYFKQHVDFTFEFLPMIIFDCALFGYMVVLIFVKWCINWDERMLAATCELINPNTGAVEPCPDATSTCYVHGFGPDSGTPLACAPGTDKGTTSYMCPLNYGGTGDGCQPPNLINTLISIALSPGSVTEPMFSGQDKLQVFLLLLAFACVPVLLCAKPCIVHNRAKKRAAGAEHAALAEHVEGHEHEEAGGHHGGHGGGHGGHGHEEEHGFGELMIHQTIETIEFVLGMVSNTASYLRLWALSLAHSQLSEVFFEKSIKSQIESGSPLGVFIGFAIFAAVTFAVILCMDVLECFLHALRLHWVEFQNKFYKADGYKFTPLNIPALCKKVVLT